MWPRQQRTELSAPGVRHVAESAPSNERDRTVEILFHEDPSFLPWRHTLR
jgi:hypothetical protein